MVPPIHTIVLSRGVNAGTINADAANEGPATAIHTSTGMTIIFFIIKKISLLSSLLIIKLSSTLRSQNPNSKFFFFFKVVDF